MLICLIKFCFKLFYFILYLNVFLAFFKRFELFQLFGLASSRFYGLRFLFSD